MRLFLLTLRLDGVVESAIVKPLAQWPTQLKGLKRAAAPLLDYAKSRETQRGKFFTDTVINIEEIK